ncbi:hypothetical protein BpHYR1_028047 [Brachionus plicatilis]|uniref:Secreted protein n=1 Tax=Brachionus plicatilis TaxID=10195 RepID=A0A3M7SBE4_BRAPC|nr:hypothetical protein BpHYR1_028047 [Brachionus plicatilis]
MSVLLILLNNSVASSIILSSRFPDLAACDSLVSSQGLEMFHVLRGVQRVPWVFLDSRHVVSLSRGNFPILH